MNLAELQRRLIAAARIHPPSDRVPLAFERRIMALVLTCPAADQWAAWAHALWRGAVACLAVVLVVGTVAFFHSPIHPASPTGDLSQAFENTMLASVSQDADTAW